MFNIFKFWPHKNVSAAAASIDDYRRVFGSEAGQRVLVDILTQSGFYKTTPVGGPVERNEGKREIAGHIFNLVNLNENQRAQLHDLVRREQAELDKARS